MKSTLWNKMKRGALWVAAKLGFHVVVFKRVHGFGAMVTA